MASRRLRNHPYLVPFPQGWNGFLPHPLDKHFFGSVIELHATTGGASPGTAKESSASTASPTSVRAIGPTARWVISAVGNAQTCSLVTLLAFKLPEVNAYAHLFFEFRQFSLQLCGRLVTRDRVKI